MKPLPPKPSSPPCRTGGAGETLPPTPYLRLANDQPNSSLARYLSARGIQEDRAPPEVFEKRPVLVAKEVLEAHEVPAHAAQAVPVRGAREDATLAGQAGHERPRRCSP